MKKILSIFAVAATIGLTGCTETWDGNPVLKTHEGTPEVEILNKPVMQDQEILLTSDNALGNFHMTCSQPDYGYAAVATYKVQCSLTEDFARYEEVPQEFYDCAEINPLNSDIAACIEYLNDVKTEADLPIAAAPLYVRLHCYIAQSPDNTSYYSNVVKYKGVGIGGKYLAIWVSGLPTDIYLRGGLPLASDWGAIPAYNFVTGKQKDTWELHDVKIPADTEFKIADATWGSINYGGGDVTAGDFQDDDKEQKGNSIPLEYNGGNLKMKADFYGTVIFGLKSGNYYAIFKVEPEPKE